MSKPVKAPKKPMIIPAAYMASDVGPNSRDRNSDVNEFMLIVLRFEYSRSP